MRGPISKEGLENGPLSHTEDTTFGSCSPLNDGKKVGKSLSL